MFSVACSEPAAERSGPDSAVDDTRVDSVSIDTLVVDSALDAPSDVDVSLDTAPPAPWVSDSRTWLAAGTKYQAYPDDVHWRDGHPAMFFTGRTASAESGDMGEIGSGMPFDVLLAFRPKRMRMSIDVMAMSYTQRARLELTAGNMIAGGAGIYRTDVIADDAFHRVQIVIDLSRMLRNGGVGPDWVTFGVQMLGHGDLWLGDATFEQVDASVPSTPEYLGTSDPRTWACDLTSCAPDGKYTMSVDPAAPRDFHPSASLSSTTAADADWGSLVMTVPSGTAFPFDGYAGSRVRMSADVKTSGVTGGAALWMRVKTSRDFTMDNMEDRRIVGDDGWTRHSIVLDVDSDVKEIAFGSLLVGRGTIWVGDVTFERVENDVPVTHSVSWTLP